jgi:two-component system cell cycle response regulator
VKIVLAHVDDAARRRFARVLERVGHEVLAVEAAGEAVSSARAARPDVVVVDAGAGHEAREALLSEFKGDADAYRAAVVLLERPGMGLETAVSALRSGVQDFLVEPVDDAELVSRVEAAGRTKVLQEELVVQSKRLEALIFEDPLTGLSNRRFILTQLGGQVSAARRHGRPLSIAIIDIDHFKAVNDEYGHAAGDQVLAGVTRSLREHLRAEDQLGRLGGEEFLALLPDAGATAAAVAAEKLRREIAGQEVSYERRVLSVTISAGWATWGGETPDDLLRRADAALYDAKRAGRNRVAGAPASLPRRT